MYVHQVQHLVFQMFLLYLHIYILYNEKIIIRYKSYSAECYDVNRQQAEAKLKQLTSHHETTENVSQQEMMEWREKYEQTKEKAKEYSELVSSF